MFRAIRRWFRPSVRDGYTRLEWHDEDEEEYWDDWDCKESVLSNFTAHIQQQGFVLTNPTTMITSTSHHTGTYTPTAAPVGTPSFAPTPQTAFSGPLAPPSLDQAVFLYLCINTSSTDTELGEIMIADSTGRSRIRNDRKLFDAIREKYNSMKRKGVFSWMYTPKDIHYVRFDACRDLVGIVEKPKSFPPPLEVSMRRYSFAEPPMTAETFYQLYWKHEKHNKPTVAWLPYLPKKLGTSIPVDIDQREFGWGVHIIEGTDERMTAWVAAIGIMLSLAVAVIYNAKTKGDMGWTIAAWMTIVQAIVMAASYWHHENR
jgi:hypothetical protein